MGFRKYYICFLQHVPSAYHSGGFREGAPPPTAQNFLNFMQFFAKFGKIICWRHLLRRILDPPLYQMACNSCVKIFKAWIHIMVVHQRKYCQIQSFSSQFCIIYLDHETERHCTRICFCFSNKFLKNNSFTFQKCVNPRRRNKRWTFLPDVPTGRSCLGDPQSFSRDPGNGKNPAAENKENSSVSPREDIESKSQSHSNKINKKNRKIEEEAESDT